MPFHPMSSRVQEHIRKRAPRLERRADQTCVVATVEHRPVSSAEAIHELAKPSTEALHPVRERNMARAFDQQVYVIALNRVVDDAEAVARTHVRQQYPTAPHEARSPQRRNPGSHAHGDM